MNYLKLTNDKLNIQNLTELVSSPKCGAISIFVGTTRDNFEGKVVVNLEYEAYEGMAYKIMEEICEKLRKKWPTVENVAIHHRLGCVPASEASVVIAIASPHRTDALQATQWCIDTLKKSVPIWKKEIYADNNHEWKENKECAWSKFEKNELYENREQPFISADLIRSPFVTSSEHLLNMRKFIENKKREGDEANIRDFCKNNEQDKDSNIEEYKCARLDAKLIKRKDSKSHLQVIKVLNNWERDQNNFDYLRQHICKNSIEDRLKVLERQLFIGNVEDTVEVRLQNINEALFRLEAISPEFAEFHQPNMPKVRDSSLLKRKEVTIDYIDALISEKRKKICILNANNDKK